MVSRSTFLHLRIPFSYFLLPIFLFSLVISPNLGGTRLFWVFIILHFLLYPASNGYNSYFDKDEQSIGGLKHPPPVKKELYFTSILLDVAAILLGLLFINTAFALMLFVYGVVSKAYSHPAIRLKKYPITGWLVAGVFQGFFTVLMCYVGINNYNIEQSINEKVILAGSLSTLMLWANYPMTQVYQHDEDSKRGDNTISLMLGIKGTFLFTGGIFLFVTIGFVWFFSVQFALLYGLVFLCALFPVIAFFLFWFIKVLSNPEHANYSNTMMLNFVSATSLNIFFMYLFFDYTHLLDALQYM